MLQRSHGTHYCNWRDDSKNIHIWGLSRSSMMVKRTHFGNRHFVFEPRHCHLLAMTKWVHLFITLNWFYKGLIISSLLDYWDSDRKYQIKCFIQSKDIKIVLKVVAMVETVLMMVIRHKLSVSLPEGVVSFIHLFGLHVLDYYLYI